MTLSDQQLRQELLSYNETVPPITQRNREQLRARLEALRSQTRTRTTAAGSPSRSHPSASPVRTRSTASPARTRGSTESPTRTRATASPSQSLAANSPSRTRASATNTTATTTTSVSKTRSKHTPSLIELSDSEAESAPTGALMSHSNRAGQTAPNIQTRSIALRGQHKSPTSLSSSGGTGTMTDDVELSIARHRREIKQLLDSARDRPPATTTNVSSLRSGHNRESPGSTTGGRHSPLSTSQTRSGRHSSKSDDVYDDDDDQHDKGKRSPKSDHEGRKASSSLKRAGKPLQSFWKKYINLIKNLLKLLVVSSLLLGGIGLLLTKSGEHSPHPEPIMCTVKNATECEDMKPVIAAVRKQLQVRAGEVDCGFRDQSTILVSRPEIEEYLNEKGLRFNLGNNERWNALIKYIQVKPIHDILLWTKDNEQTNSSSVAYKLSSKDAIRSLTCRARQDVSKTLKNLALYILGPTGLLTLVWYLRKQSKTHDENETTYKHYLNKATHFLEEQYEKHIQDPHAQPWLAISHIRDKLIPEEDRERLKHIWERVKQQITKQDSRLRSESQEVNGEKFDVWRWIKSAAASPKKTTSPSKDAAEESDVHTVSEVGLTECLKLRNCFRSDNYADDEEIDHVVDSIQKRCVDVKRIEHIGIHSVFVYLKFSSKEAAAQGYHLLNNWKSQDRVINVKYIRVNRYLEHFPEARDVSSNY